ncbi:MAG: cysteine hydrolase family protein [Nitrospinota bacterium]
MERERLLEWVAPGRCALLVVDVQNDFCHPEGVFGRRGFDLSMIGEMVPRLCRFIEAAKRASVPVVYLRYARRREGEWPALERLRRLRFGEAKERVLWEGTWGAAFYGGIRPDPEDVVVTKPRYGGFMRTDLEAVLGRLGAKTLILSGVATNVCVETTAREAFMLDYDVVLVSDGCAAYSRALHEGALENVRENFGVVLTAEEVLEAWAVGSKSA